MKAILLSLFFMTAAFSREEFAKMTNAEKIQWSFNTLNKNNVAEVVDEFYHADLEFSDPIVKVKGREAMKKYYSGMYKNVKAVKFNFNEFVVMNDTVVGVWVMTLQTDALNGGEPFTVEGNSLIRFRDGKAIYHRDYFDVGAMVYEKIPVVGWMVRKVKSKLESEDK